MQLSTPSSLQAVVKRSNGILTPGMLTTVSKMAILTFPPFAFHWVCALDLDNLGRRSLRDVRHCLLARPVDGGEVQDVVALFELQIAQDGVDACCGVGKVHHCLGRCVQKLSRRQFEGTIVKGDM
jgi:hypothetical protein